MGDAWEMQGRCEGRCEGRCKGRYKRRCMGVAGQMEMLQGEMRGR